MLVVGINVAVQADAVLTGNKDLAGVGIYKPAVARRIHVLRKVNVPAHTIIHRQLGRETPGILNVGEQPVLPLGSIGGVAHVTSE